MTAEHAGMQPWIQAARPVAHGMIALPLLLGQALALATQQQFHWQWLILIQLYGVFCQAHALYLNDYADESLDRQNQTYWLSGGSRVIPEGKLTGRQLYRGSFFWLTGILFVAAIAWIAGRPLMPALAALAVFSGWTYSLNPLKSSYRGFGELHQALTCGVLLPVTAFYLQCGTLESFPWAALIPAFLMFYAGNMITALPDIAADSQGGKQTFPVRHGELITRRISAALLLLAYIATFAVHISIVEWRFADFLLWIVPLALVISASQVSRIPLRTEADKSGIKRFVSLTSASLAWMMTAWTIMLFWRPAQSTG